MKYKLIGDNNTLDILETILKNRGITNIKTFLNPSSKGVIHYSKLKNINKACDCLLKHIENKSKIFVQVDSDPDGYTSSAMLINYLKDVFSGVDIEWKIHKGKQHGVILSDIPDDVELVIIPDAGSSQYKEHKELYNKGINVIVLDHHETEKESEYAIIVNNQISTNYDNKQLSGAGVTKKFLECLDDRLGIKKSDEYLDLVALGNISDVMDLTHPETRYYVYEGLKNIKNPFFIELLKKAEFFTKGKVNPKTISWNITPAINAMIRVGKHEEKEEMFLAFLGKKDEVENQRTKKIETWAEMTARKCTNAKSRQKTQRDKAFSNIVNKIETEGLDKNRFLVIEVNDDFNTNLTGVVAIAVAKAFNKPTVLIHWSEEKNAYSGSLRGIDSVLEDTKEFLSKLNLFEYVEGHPQAAGVLITKDNINKLNNTINEAMQEYKEDIAQPVDFIIKESMVRKDIIDEVVRHEDLWGKGCEEPLIVIEGIEVNGTDIKTIGKNETMYKFNINGIEYINFNGDKDTLSKVGEDVGLVVDAMVRFGVNEYQGNITPQCIIENIKIKEEVDSFFVF